MNTAEKLTELASIDHGTTVQGAATRWWMLAVARALEAGANEGGSNYARAAKRHAANWLRDEARL